MVRKVFRVRNARASPRPQLRARRNRKSPQAKPRKVASPRATRRKSAQSKRRPRATRKAVRNGGDVPLVALQKYCSCQLQVAGKQGDPQNRSYKQLSPSGICAKTVWQLRGKPQPANIVCRFPRKILAQYPVETLRGYLIFEKVLSDKQAAKLSKAELVNRTHQYMHRRAVSRTAPTRTVTVTKK